MQRSFLRQHAPKLVLIPALFCSGCFNQQSYSNNDQIVPSRQYVAFSPVKTEAEQLPMDETESASEIREEVEALNHSGSWQTQLSSVQAKQKTQKKKDSLHEFPIVRNKQVEAYIQLFQGKQHRTFARFLKRSGRYIDMMEKEFASRGMPKELAYLSLVESGFNPRARSYASAVGLWQFMAATGRDYNLKVNKYVDERCNIEKSTKAAANYLGDLFRDFGDWYLAVAAYNAGPGNIHRGLKTHDVDNFWDLADRQHLKMETVRYVPKLLASIIIARNPEKFGFSNLKLDEPLQFDTISVGPSFEINAAALVAECSKDEIIQLNPELMRKITPANQAKYRIRIPKGKISVAQNNMKRLHRVASIAYKTHKIRKKDTIFKVCKKYGISTTTLLKVNHLKKGKLIRGKTLRIPYNTIAYKLLPKGVTNAALANNGMILHKVKKGDTVGAIAQRYHVPVQMIVAWNDLHSAKTIRIGQKLSIFFDDTKHIKVTQKRTNSKSSTKYLAATQIKQHKQQKQPKKPVLQTSSQPIAIAAVQKKIMHKNGKKDSATHLYSVQNGDSLWTISRKFQISMAEIKQMNSLKSNFLKPGRTLKIKKS